MVSMEMVYRNKAFFVCLFILLFVLKIIDDMHIYIYVHWEHRQMDLMHHCNMHEHVIRH